MPPENLQALKKVTEVKANVPLATGERLFSKWEFRELIEQQIVEGANHFFDGEGKIDELTTRCADYLDRRRQEIAAGGGR